MATAMSWQLSYIVLHVIAIYGISVKGSPVLTAREVAAALTYYQIETKVDYSKECKDWTSSCVNQKHLCHRSSTSKFCQKTCKKCPEHKAAFASDKCEDTYALCEDSKYYGFCQRNSGFWPIMQQHCRKTCAICRDPLSQMPACTDKLGASYCLYVKRFGVCANRFYRSFARRNCQKTCNHCQEVACGRRKIPSGNGASVGHLVAGSTARKGDWPWQVAVLRDGSFHCGGTLVRSNAIVSAAHCFKNAHVERFTFVVGEYDRRTKESTEQYHKAEKIIVHHKFKDLARRMPDTVTFDNDIALIKLRRKVEFDSFVLPACLPQPHEQLGAGKKCYVAGWGSKHAGGRHQGVLQQIKIPSVDWKRCQKRNDRQTYRTLTKSMICGGYDGTSDFEAACHGDSGGPLLCQDEATGRWVLHGVVSWGSGMCSSMEAFTVFTRVSKFITWIDKHF